MFDYIDWRLNASRGLSAIADFLVLTPIECFSFTVKAYRTEVITVTVSKIIANFNTRESLALFPNYPFSNLAFNHKSMQTF